MGGGGVIFSKMYGLRLGTAIGVASTFGGQWLGSVCAFILGRRCCSHIAQEHLQKHGWMLVVNKMIEKEGIKVVFLARMSPLLPAEVFNYVCSLTSLSLTAFAIGSVGSVVPTSLWVISAASA